MFKVSSKSSLLTLQPHTASLQNIDLELLANYCQIEDWYASAESGIFTLGDLSSYQHNISSSCGLLPLINSYTPEDRDRITEIFDVVCAQNSTFSYSTTIIGTDGHEQPVVVIGESIIENVSEAIIKGVFIFPHFHKEPAQKFRQ
ncbi:MULTISPECIES: hypothetical protein [unclassified Lentilitoribacter]|uniref:hypothetical protein n=1 Tax=unclassified Lentilitoribacter TaxID=2647570 RepID=UPI0013A6C302|nr:hypothetical protein [Lentilitoribacter sp. Alg239-R112]